ncbi:uncharacterized protein LOC143606457 [Bidens hawaiensis]|uniref:uncharacterized protein LOC143606457 n=1 Tax=Bidens hawaiensis TaxID=980011 RepID=UPI00404B0742
MEHQVCVDVLSATNANEKPEHFVSVDDDTKEEINTKEKPRSAKKPPRPQRALSLDAADQKLIKELAQLSMIKRARMERMKALLAQKKASKASSSSSSSLFAMIFTIIVFVVILFQGMSCQISCGTLDGSPQPQHETNENALIFIHQELNPSAQDSV